MLPMRGNDVWLLAVHEGKQVSMASADKTLGRVSAWSTLVLLAGIVGLMFLPEHKSDSGSNAKPQGSAQTVATAPPPGQPAPAKTDPAGNPAGNSTANPADDVWTEAELTAALRECVRLLAPVAAEVALDEPMKHGQCGTPAPLLLHSIGGTAKVSFDPPPLMNCRLAAGLARWVDTVLQPTAREVLGARITRIVGASSYACRNIYNKPNLPLSEHATGNAVDIAAFVTADGRTISVAKGWGATERDIAAAQKKAVADAAKAESKKTKAAAADEESATPIEPPTKKSSVDKKPNVHKTGLRAERAMASPVVTATVSITAAKTTEAAFLRRLHHGACSVFGTVLGPEANEAHRDHFHFDMKERKIRGICH
jgi:hypothetical protein